MFVLELKNQADIKIILKNLNPVLLKAIAEDINQILTEIMNHKYYMEGEYCKILFDNNKFLISKNTKKCVELILLNQE